jgi:thiol-disulfide isomerase/thioredoxin
MSIDTIEFIKLDKELAKTYKSPIDVLASEIGKVYVVAITRDGCPACKRQKPKLDKLAAVEAKKHANRVAFSRIHVKYEPESQDESMRSKDVFHHYFYPTNLILIRTRDRGAIEYYRNAAPRMSELERNIEAALQTAQMIEKAR